MPATDTRNYTRVLFQVEIHYGPELGRMVDTREYDTAEQAAAAAATTRAVRPDLTVKAVRVTRTTTITTATEELQ